MDAQLKNEIAETISKVIKVFTVQYTKAYLLALVRLIELETNKKPKEWQLMKRPVCIITSLSSTLCSIENH